MALLIVRHNIEVAHRLFELRGKCENIHGHSMWVELGLYGGISGKGLVQTGQTELEFGEVKRTFRGYLDENFDHRLLLNQDDPWAEMLYQANKIYWDQGTGDAESLPGLRVCPGDPTTEHLAIWFAEYFSNAFKTDATVTVKETHVNAAQVDWTYEEES